MSVAAHVSRVSKDYAPFGYSVMNRHTFLVEDENGNIPNDAVNPSTLDYDMPILYADKGGLWIESIQVVWPGGYPAGDPATDRWVVDVQSATYPGPGVIQTMFHMETNLINPPIPPGGNNNIPIPDVSRYVPPGSFISVHVHGDRSAGAGPIGPGPQGELLIQFHVRYRALA